MKKLIFHTNSSDLTTFILRITLALVIFPHGFQKLTGAFGGFGFEGSMNYFTGTVGLPWVLGFTVIMVESIGMILLASGLFTRIISLLLVVIMLGAASTHLANGFFINWFNNQPGEGIEFFILAIALALNSAVRGAGRFSIDGLIARRFQSSQISSLA